MNFFAVITLFWSQMVIAGFDGKEPERVFAEGHRPPTQEISYFDSPQPDPKIDKKVNELIQSILEALSQKTVDTEGLKPFYKLLNQKKGVFGKSQRAEYLLEQFIQSESFTNVLNNLVVQRAIKKDLFHDLYKDPISSPRYYSILSDRNGVIVATALGFTASFAAMVRIGSAEQEASDKITLAITSIGSGVLTAYFVNKVSRAISAFFFLNEPAMVKKQYRKIEDSIRNLCVWSFR